MRSRGSSFATACTMCACRRALRARTSTSPLLSQSTGRSSSRASSRTITTRCLPLPLPPGRWRAGTCLRCAAPISTSASPRSRAATLAKASRATTWWRWLASSVPTPPDTTWCAPRRPSPRRAPCACASALPAAGPSALQCARSASSPTSRRRWWRGRRQPNGGARLGGAELCLTRLGDAASRPSVRSRRRW